MAKFHITVPQVGTAPASVEFFNNLEVIEWYAEHLVEEGKSDAFVIYHGERVASCVVTMPSTKDIMVFREPDYMEYMNYSVGDLLKYLAESIDNL